MRCARCARSVRRDDPGRIWHSGLPSARKPCIQMTDVRASKRCSRGACASAMGIASGRHHDVCPTVCAKSTRWVFLSRSSLVRFALSQL